MKLKDLEIFTVAPPAPGWGGRYWTFVKLTTDALAPVPFAGAYVAAANRAKYVLETYARTPAVEDALGVMTEAYVKMGMPRLAADSLRVLERNYPQSPALPKLNARVKNAG